jgi:hypothetical protein
MPLPQENLAIIVISWPISPVLWGHIWFVSKLIRLLKPHLLPIRLIPNRPKPLGWFWPKTCFWLAYSRLKWFCPRKPKLKLSYPRWLHSWFKSRVIHPWLLETRWLHPWLFKTRWFHPWLLKPSWFILGCSTKVVLSLVVPSLAARIEADPFLVAPSLVVPLLAARIEVDPLLVAPSLVVPL